MKNIAACLLPALLCLSSCSSHGDALLGTWKSDHQLTADSLRKDGDQQTHPAPGADPLLDTDATLAFTADGATIDAPNSGIEHAQFNFAIVSSSPGSVTISMPDPGRNIMTTSTFHFDGNDVMWTQNDKGNPFLPLGNYRQYYRRLR